MKKRESVYFSVRTDKEIADKVRYIASHESRFVSRQIEQFIKRGVAEFEHVHGEIKAADSEDEE